MGQITTDYLQLTLYTYSLTIMLNNLSYDLIDFDLAHRVFPTNACSFIVHMCGVVVPPDTTPVFDTLYGNRVGTTNDFEAVAFYGDFTRLVNAHSLTSTVKNHIMGYFQVEFKTDPVIDLMCGEAFKTAKNKATNSTSKDTKRTNSTTKDTKRAKKYNSPVITTRCDNCDTQQVRLKLIKKVTTCCDKDLVKFKQFASDLKLENNLMQSLPPTDEVDLHLFNEMSTVIQNREQDVFEYIHVVLPTHVDRIKTAWYETPRVFKEILYVPDTQSDTSL